MAHEGTMCTGADHCVSSIFQLCFVRPRLRPASISLRGPAPAPQAGVDVPYGMSKAASLPARQIVAVLRGGGHHEIGKNPPSNLMAKAIQNKLTHAFLPSLGFVILLRRF